MHKNDSQSPLLGRPLPTWVLDLLASPPQRGGGFNNWLFRAAKALHPYRAEEDIRALLENAATACGGAVRHDEIPRAIANSKAHAWQPDGANRNGSEAKSLKSGTPWPDADEKAVAKILSNSASPGLVDLWERSPIRLDDPVNGTLSETIIDTLFPGDPLLCVGRSSRDFASRRREEWRGELAEMQLIVPSPMSKPAGKRKGDGKLSAHTLDNTGPRRFLAVEFDSGSFDAHAALLWRLAAAAPLALAVLSGSKSLHGWFYCGGQSEANLRRFMRFAVSLGADPATWTRSQFVRLPDGLRDNGQRQSVVYFNLACLPPPQSQKSAAVAEIHPEASHE